MARYCFYCGRALSSGEKCLCRTPGASSTAQTQSASTSTSSQSAAGKTAGSTAAHQTGSASGAAKGGGRTAVKESAFKRFFRAFNPFDKTAPAARKTAPKTPPKQKSRPTGQRNAYQGSRPGFQFNPRALLPELRRLGAYLIQPADSIRSAAQTGTRQSVLLILVLQGVLGGIFLSIATNQPLLRSLLELSITPSSQSGTFIGKLFIFVQGFGFCLAGNLLLALTYLIALRYMFRHPVSYSRLLTAMSPSGFYLAIFMLAGMLSLSASLFSALMMLVAGVAVATIAQFLSMRTLSGFDDNRNFILVTMVTLIFTGVIAMLLNLSLPLLQAMLNQSAII